MTAVFDKLAPCHCCGGTGTEINQVATGAELRKLRLDANISLGSHAQRMQISGPYLSDLERGNRKWTPALMERFMRALKEGQKS